MAELHNQSTHARLNFVPSGDESLATSVDLPPTGEAAGPHPVVIVAHGLTGNRIGRSYHMVEFGRRLAAQGIACVRFDQRGCGESTGRFVDLTIPAMAADCCAIAQWARQQPWCDGERTGYLGISMGALPTVAADAAHPGSALALWAPVYDMPRVFWNTARTGLQGILEGQGWVPYRGLAIGKPMIDQLNAVATPEKLAANDSPVLVFHSKADETVNFEEGAAYEARCYEVGRSVRFETSATANHDFSEYEDRQRLLGTTVEFFESCLA